MAKNFKREKLTVVQKNRDATICSTPSGRKVVLMTPSGKFKRYERELNSRVNSRTGKPLNDCAAGYRMGYRAALGEQAKIYNKKNR